MPIDANIPLQVQGPQPQPGQNPLEQYGRIQALLNAQQQSRIGAQQLQAFQLENQQRQLDLDDQRKMTQAYTDAGGDPDKMFDLAAKAGVRPKTLIGLKATLLDQAQKRALLNKTELEGQSEKNDLLNGLLQPVLAESDPARQKAVYDQQMQLALQRGVVTPQEAAQHPYTGPDQVKQYANGLTTDKWLTAQAAQIRAGAAQTQAGTTQAKETREAQQQEFQTAISSLGANPPASPAEYQQRVGKLSPANAQKIFSAVPVGKYDPATSGETLRKLGMTPEQQQTALNAQNTLAESIKRDAEAQRHNLTQESISKLSAAVGAGRLQQERMVNGMKYGPGTQEYWVQQLQENPDSIKEMPAELRSSVGAMFKQKTGLPLPTPLPAAGQQSETAARNALDGVAFIRQAIQNPEVRANIGPIMGRLGDASQAIGTAVGLSPEAARLAQELRTRMRYFVFQEGKAVLGGRLPQQLMQSLESSSANVKMDANLLQGALDGAANNSQSILDNADKQRFGGKMRSREMRGLPAQAAGSGKIAVKAGDGTTHMFDTDAQAKQFENLVKEAGGTTSRP